MMARASAMSPAAVAKFEAIAMMTGVTTLVARSGAGPSSSPRSASDVPAHPHLAAAIGRPPGPPPAQDLFERTLRALLTGLLVVDPDG